MTLPPAVALPVAPPPAEPVPANVTADLGVIAAFWVASYIGYYLGLPALGYAADYNANPMPIGLYYLFCTGAALIQFWPIYLTWGHRVQWIGPSSRILSHLLWIAVFGGCTAFAAVFMPQLEPAQWPTAWGPAPDIALAVDHYFLPKSLDIVFQQCLIVALVLVLGRQTRSLWQLSVACGVLFGGMHLMLVASQLPWIAVIRFIVFAALYGGAMPWLILRLRSGFVVGFLLHWSYYALTVLLVQVYGAGALLTLLTGQ